MVKINPEVARADLKIGISSVVPHPMAGYSGGPKIVMPGICDFDFIRDHHMKNVIHPRSVAGVLDGNPFQGGILQVAKAVGLDFSINCVYNRKGQVSRIVGGSSRLVVLCSSACAMCVNSVCFAPMRRAASTASDNEKCVRCFLC